MSSTLTIGIDLGGTYIKGGLVGAAGEIIRRESIETQAARGFEHVLSRMISLIRELFDLADRPVRGVGVGVPGPMCHTRGIIHAAPNLPGWVNVPLRDRMADELGGLSVNIENDANAAAFGEFVAGAGRGCDNMIMLTLGTGVGGGVIVDGRLTRGAFDNAGEVGHMIVEMNGRACPCGQNGCLERYSSAAAIGERAAEALRGGAASSLTQKQARGITSEVVAAAAAAGDPLARRIWDEACSFLALACVNLQHTLNPECIVLGGGLIESGSALLDPLRRHYSRLTWRVAADHPRIVPATLGGSAGLIGAARLAESATLAADAKP